MYYEIENEIKVLVLVLMYLTMDDVIMQCKLLSSVLPGIWRN